jgi:hypothetical protein
MFSKGMEKIVASFDMRQVLLGGAGLRVMAFDRNEMKYKENSSFSSYKGIYAILNYLDVQVTGLWSTKSKHYIVQESKSNNLYIFDSTGIMMHKLTGHPETHNGKTNLMFSREIFSQPKIHIIKQYHFVVQRK